MEFHHIGISEVPGLNKPLTAEELAASCEIYNTLPDDADQPQILESHIHALTELFVRHRAHRVLGLHLVHAHFRIPESTAMLGVNYEKPHCRWTKPTNIDTIDIRNIHAHISVLAKDGFHPYEYQVGPAPDLSDVDSAFLPEFAKYLNENRLSTLLGLQVIDQDDSQMLELILPMSTIMLSTADLHDCNRARQTGWKFAIEHGKPRIHKPNETHGTHANGHDVFNEGTPHPQLETFSDLTNALVQTGILRV
ncbi:hypothetical protein ACMFMG_011771 [Clarireedia jacksonii]